MSQKIAMIKNNVVENPIKWDGVSHWAPAMNGLWSMLQAFHYPIGVGYLYNPMLEPSFIQPQRGATSE